MVLGFYARTGNPVHLWKLKVTTAQPFLRPQPCSLQVWVPSWIGFLVGVAAGAGLFFTINAWGIVVPVAVLSPVWIFGIVRTGSFGLSTCFRSSDNADHQELKD
jgi:hypothetical protein